MLPTHAQEVAGPMLLLYLEPTQGANVTWVYARTPLQKRPWSRNVLNRCWLFWMQTIRMLPTHAQEVTGPMLLLYLERTQGASIGIWAQKRTRVEAGKHGDFTRVVSWTNAKDDVIGTLVQAQNRTGMPVFMYEHKNKNGTGQEKY